MNVQIRLAFLEKNKNSYLLEIKISLCPLCDLHYDIYHNKLEVKCVLWLRNYLISVPRGNLPVLVLRRPVRPRDEPGWTRFTLFSRDFNFIQFYPSFTLPIQVLFTDSSLVVNAVLVVRSNSLIHLILTLPQKTTSLSPQNHVPYLQWDMETPTTSPRPSTLCVHL